MSNEPLPDGSPLLGTMRSAWCGELRASHDGARVTLCGWVAGMRDLGGLLFLDLRDRSGLVQVVIDPEGREAMDAARPARHEWVLRVEGAVRRREGGVNDDLPTGAVEVAADGVEILSRSTVPPFLIEDDVKASEELRLKHRHLDLRRPAMQRLLILRHRAAQAMRRSLDEQGLLEIETPILFKSTPEGARDYLVPSRVHPGEFYALPQSPQILKQVLMISGFEGYYQLARCFRDEDLRGNRQPEFTQVDLEMSFCTQEDVQRVTEHCMAAAWEATTGKRPATPFPRLSHADAMLRYGSDKPDRRFELEISDLTDALHESEFKVVGGAGDRGEVVRALAVPDGAGFSRKDMDLLTEVAKARGAKGLAWIKVGGDEPFSGPPVKFLKQGELEAIARGTGAERGSACLLVTAAPDVAAAALGAVRLACGDRLGLRPTDRWAFCWVQDFPLFETDDETGRLTPAHHPFCMPHPEDVARLDDDPASVRALAYDLACNGEETAGGSIRVHRPDVQSRIFDLIGLSKDEAKDRFGFFLDALAHGAPPHGGIAIGFDRVVMLVGERDNLRDVIAFPKTASASDLMADAPSAVDPAQLEELRLEITKKR